MNLTPQIRVPGSKTPSEPRIVPLLLLAMTAFAGDLNGATTTIDGTIANSDRVVGTEPAGRSYAAAFLEALDRLELPEPGDLPATKPGRLEVTFPQGGEHAQYRITLDTERQVLHLSAPAEVESSWDHRVGENGDWPLNTSMAAADISNTFRSASVLAFKAKQFDDGLYAAVEIAADQGTDRFPSRHRLLADLATALSAGRGGADTDGALALLGAATKLDGHPVEISSAAATLAANIETRFLADPLRSKPIGFYTWSQMLSGIFQRDRLLQTKLKRETSKAFATALGSDAGLLARYQAALRLPGRLTNRFANEALDGAAAEAATGKEPALLNDMALFPPSRAYETDLIKQLYPGTPVPDGFDLANEMVRRIQSGELQLQPDEDSGFYDYQTYALEPLLIPDQMREEIPYFKLGRVVRYRVGDVIKALEERRVDGSPK